LIATLTCIETCRSYSIRRNRETRHLELQYGLRRCLHLYRYRLTAQGRRAVTAVLCAREASVSQLAKDVA